MLLFVHNNAFKWIEAFKGNKNTKLDDLYRLNENEFWK